VYGISFKVAKISYSLVLLNDNSGINYKLKTRYQGLVMKFNHILQFLL